MDRSDFYCSGSREESVGLIHVGLQTIYTNSGRSLILVTLARTTRRFAEFHYGMTKEGSYNLILVLVTSPTRTRHEWVPFDMVKKAIIVVPLSVFHGAL